MKTRLPKMLLAALLAAMTSAYALPSYVIIDGGHQYYQGGSSGDPTVITNADEFGSGISSAPASTVNIGYGNDGGVAYDAYFTLSGDDFTTPNALFIGGPGWPHTLTEGYEAAKGVLTIDDGATLTVDTHISMGTCEGAGSELYIQGNSKVYADHLQVSSGGGEAIVSVGGDSEGYLHLNGNLSIGVNNVTGQEHMANKMEVREGGTVVVAGTTSIGYATDTYCGAEGMLFIHPDAVVNTDSLEMGIGMMTDAIRSKGDVSVSGTLNVTNVTGSGHETIIGLNGGYGILRVCEGGIVNLGNADVRLGSTNQFGDTTNAELIADERSVLLTHKGTMYVGDKGTVSKETGMPNYGVGQLVISDEATARLNIVEVSEDSRILVTGTLKVDETPDAYGIQGVRLYNGAILAGSPDNQGGKLTFSVVPEHNDGTEVIIDNFTLTDGTTLKACCDTHLTVGGGKTLTFDGGTIWLTDGIAYINEAAPYNAGTITSTVNSGTISVAGNTEINYFLNIMGSEKSGSLDKVALIDVSGILDNSGTVTSELREDDTLKLDRAGYEVRFADEGVLTRNAGDGFRGFYVVKTTNAGDAYPTFDRNQRAVYDLIKQMEESGLPIPKELEDVINVVLNMDGINQAAEIREALDFLGAVNYSVMMHNQVEGNLNHQRMLRNRSMAGRNLRHAKGCANLYASGFYDNQRLKGDRSKGEGYRRSEWGGLIGGDTCINEDWRIGADLALGWSNITPSHNMKLKQRSFYWDIYAQFQKGNWRSHTSVGMGIHNFKVERGIGGLTARNNHVRGTSLNISEEVTYDWKINEKSTVQPFVAVDLSWNRIKDFTDGDLGALNVHVAKQSAFIAEFTLGGRYIRDFACVTDAPDATWYFQLGVAVDAGKTDSDMKCNFVGTPDQQFTIKAADRDRVGLDLGTGLTMPVSAHWAIYGNAEIILRGDSHNFGAQLGAQYAF
ncbi:MAG: autotransporter outer membrane beta-barrel domain-containing protein [Akkermansia sp.]|nr:autotransporter outer membrane beta-barrel domain-containing protein [Akkermansia sp.]